MEELKTGPKDTNKDCNENTSEKLPKGPSKGCRTQVRDFIRGSIFVVLIIGSSILYIRKCTDVYNKNGSNTKTQDPDVDALNERVNKKTIDKILNNITMKNDKLFFGKNELKYNDTITYENLELRHNDYLGNYNIYETSYNKLAHKSTDYVGDMRDLGDNVLELKIGGKTYKYKMINGIRCEMGDTLVDSIENPKEFIN